MRFPNDDDLYNLQLRFFGPKRLTFPIIARFISWGLLLPVLVMVTWAERLVGMNMGVLTWLASLGISMSTVYRIAEHIDNERPFTALLVVCWYELSGPRRRRREVVTVEFRRSYRREIRRHRMVGVGA